MYNKWKIISLLACCMLLSPTYALDKVDLKVCNAYKNDKDKAQCIKELELREYNKLSKQKKIDKRNQLLKKAKSLIKELAPTAATKCKKMAIERAKYRYETNNKENDFEYIRITSNRVMEIYGDNLKLENGFGAWSFYTYKCSYVRSEESIYLDYISQGKILTRNNTIFIPRRKEGMMKITNPSGVFFSPQDLSAF